MAACSDSPTPSQTVGPFFGFALPYDSGPQLVSPDTPGAVRIEGHVFDGAGDPVPDALVEIWQADASGVYATKPDAGFTGFGRCQTDRDGAFHFLTIKPGPTPGPDGTIQAPHLKVTLFARGLLRHLVTRMYFPDEAADNAEDPFLNLVPPEGRTTLIARQSGADGGTLCFDICLQGDRETVFYAV